MARNSGLSSSTRKLAVAVRKVAVHNVAVHNDLCCHLHGHAWTSGFELEHTFATTFMLHRLKSEGENKSRLKVEYTLVYVTSVNAFIKKAIERGKAYLHKANPCTAHCKFVDQNYDVCRCEQWHQQEF